MVDIGWSKRNFLGNTGKEMHIMIRVTIQERVIPSFIFLDPATVYLLIKYARIKSPVKIT
jgi:hypothetical protein